eukprot:12915523-Prorocentrum_lima.AAC.1
MKVVPWDEHALMHTHGFQPTDATLVEAINMLPKTALDPSLIPQDLHLQVCFITSGSPTLERGIQHLIWEHTLRLHEHLPERVSR